MDTKKLKDIVNQRFIEAFFFIREREKLTDKEFGGKIGLHKQTIYDIQNGKSKVNTGIVSAFLTTYPSINPSWLLTGEGEMLRGKLGEVQENTAPQPRSEGNLKGNLKGNLSPESPLEITVKDEEGARLVPMINVRAAAGFGALQETTDIRQLIRGAPVLRLPHDKLGPEQHLAIEVDGDSMHPTLFDGDYVVVRKLEDPANQMTDTYLYAITHKEGVYVKRCLNRLKERGEVVAKSDNRKHGRLRLRGEDIIEVWEVKARISFQFPDINRGMFERVVEVEDQLAIVLERLNRGGL